MGNSCGVATVKKVVTLGGTRNQAVSLNRPRNTKPASVEKVKSDKTINEESTKVIKHDEARVMNQKELPKRRESKAASIRANRVNNNITTVKNRIQTKTPQKLPNKIELDPPKPTVPRMANKPKPPKKEKAPRIRRKRHSKKIIMCKSSSTSSAGGGNIKKTKFDSKPQHQPNQTKQNNLTFGSSFEWKKDENRLLAEYKVASDRIRSSLRIEQRAKAEAQMWRSKLERIALEHRERLFRQAGSLRYRLRNAEDLLCYHELRERRMQATNEKMKGLIDSVKEEARSLRVESEKRRQATQRNFDEKLSTIACELDRIRSKMDNTRLSCLAKTVTSDPEITSDSTAQITASRASESLSCLVAKKRTVVPTTNSGFSTTVPPVIKHHNILSSLPTKFRRHTVNSGYELKELAQYSRHYNAKFAACSPVQHDRKTNSSSSTSIHASQQNVTGYCNQSTGNACYCCSSNSSNKTPKRRLNGEKSVQINEKTINTTDAVNSLNQIQTRPFTMKTNFARLTQSVTGAKCASCQPNCCSSQEETSHQVPGASDSLSSTPLRNYLIRRSACESTFDTSLHSGRLCVGTINQSMGSPTHSNAHTRTPHAECMCSTFESPISSNCVKMVDNNQDVTARYQVITSYSRNSSAYPSSC